MVDAWDQFPDAQQITGTRAADMWDQFPDHQPQKDGELSWSDVPMQAAQNLGSSAVRTAQNIVYPFVHPIDTLTGIKRIGEGAVSKAAGALGVEQDPQQKAETEAPINAVGQFFADRYGGMENIKRTLAEDPVGVMADAAAVLSGGGALASRGPGVIGAAGRTVAKAGSAIDPIANAGRLARVGGKAASAALGVTTGVGNMPVEYAYAAGKSGNQTFLDNMRGIAPMSDTLDMAKSAVSEFGKERGAAYQAGMATVNADKSAISFQPIRDAVRNAYAVATYKGIPKSDEVMKVYNTIVDSVERFTNTPGAGNAEGLDALKQVIGEVRQKTQHGTLERKIADNIYNATKAEIVKQVPGYAATMKDYAAASEQINDITKTFSLGEKASKDTALRKLTSVMRNNVNTNYGQRAKLMDELARKEPDLPYAIAGQSMNALAPRGLSSAPAAYAAYQGLTNPLAVAALPATSPRVVGEAAYGAGRAVGSIEDMANALHVSPTVFINALLSAYGIKQATQPQPLQGGIGPRYDDNGNLRR